MRIDDYQREAMSTASAVDSSSVTVAALGLAGEAGEFADHVKKFIAQGHPIDHSKLDAEAGDILWYLALYAQATKTTLSNIAAANLSKLRARYPKGFEAERSMNREESPLD